MKSSMKMGVGVFLCSCVFVFAGPILSSAEGFDSITELPTISISVDTGEKPQSKVWTYDGKWWCVLPSTTASSAGTWIWKLVGTQWVEVLKLSNDTDTHADVKSAGNLAHIMLYGSAPELISVEYSGGTYQLWSGRSTPTPISLPDSEIATIDIDSTGRMWLSSESGTDIVVYYSDSPYSTWHGPLTLTSGISEDDISAVKALPNNTIGVLWSNQVTKRFGFRVHTDGANPNVWSDDEVPASQSALNVGNGMADDHLNVTVASNGTLYAAVKTSYDTPGYAKIALLVRRPSGAWDNLYDVDDSGTRGIVLLNESESTITVVYTSSEGTGNILYKQSLVSEISFGPRQTLMTGSLNNPTSTKQKFTKDVVILASNGDVANAVLATSSSLEQGLVGHWQMEENGGTTFIDSTSYGNNGTLFGSPSWVPGVYGSALALNGSTQYGTVPVNSSLDVTNAITLAAWVKPNKQATQDLIKKATNGSIDGYELSLASPTSTSAPNKVFARFNQATSLETYRINSTTDYPIDGSWVHLAVTYDGATIRLYFNGVEESTIPAMFTIATNTLPLSIGAQNDGQRFFSGQIDDVRIYNRALTIDEIQTLAQAPPQNNTDLSITKDDGKIEALPGDPVTYTIVVTNNGPNDVSGANVTDNVPTNITGISWTTGTTGGAHSMLVSGTGNINDTVSMPNGSTITYTINATFASGAVGIISNTATLTPPSGTIDTNPANNSATDTTMMTSLADPNLVAFYEMEENGGTTLVDSSTFLHNGTLFGSPTWVTGVNGLGLFLNDSPNQYATIPDDLHLNITKKITLMAWVKPGKTATQYIIKKAVMNSTDGYELSLSSAGKAFVRLNQKTSADTYRVNSVTSYPTNGTTWMHLAATYDGSNIRLYVNGIEDGTPKAASINIATNTLAMGIGQTDNSSKFKGSVDDVRVYNRALNASEIRPAVPNVVNTTQVAAQTNITQTGLRIGNVTATNSNTIPAGNVISQTPISGTQVIIGTQVGLVISLGPKQYTISGTVTVGGTPLKDVVMNGLPGNPLTDVNGFYSAKVNDGSTITVTPAKTGYSFDPNSRTHSNVTSDQLSENYTGTILTYTISGTITAGGTPLKDVTMNGLPGNPLTDANGFYSVPVDYGWSGTITPSKYAYTFNPNSKPYSNVTSGQNGQNYTSILLSYVISGHILDPNDKPVKDVSVNSTNGGGLDTTDPNGYYEIPVPYNWSGTITPAKAKHTFNPVDKQYVNILVNQTDQNYVGTSIYDLDPDGIIDLGDIAVMSDNWLETDEGIPGDFNNDGIVNFLDFAEFAKIWQEQ